ncbi:hypothetical protein LCGC14_2669900, partial [marine sediment metagenome]
MREDLETIVARASALGMTVVLGTNGTLLTDDRAGELAQRGLAAVGISLDSLLAWRHDDFRGRKGAWKYYYLYGMERVGMISGLRNFGRRDWYREGAAHLAATRRGGSWGQLYDTAFALLFLAKGNRPVLFQKLRWQGIGTETSTTWRT